MQTIEEIVLHLAYDEINNKNASIQTFYCLLSYINKQDHNDTH